MLNRAYVIKVDGTTYDIDHQPTLVEAQKIVGGYVELLPRSYVRNPQQVIMVDEEGRLTHKKPNQVAAGLAYTVLVGDVLVLEGWRSLK